METIFICKFPLCRWRCQSGEEFCSPHLFFVDADHRCHNCLSSIPPEFDHLKLCAQCHQARVDCIGGRSPPHSPSGGRNPPQPPSEYVPTEGSGRSPPKKVQKSSLEDDISHPRSCLGGVTPQKFSKKDFPSLKGSVAPPKSTRKWGTKTPTKVMPCVAPHSEVSEKQPITIPLQSDSIPIVKSPSPVKPLSPVDHLLADI